MGLYINPDEVSKEQWLVENGALLMSCPPSYKQDTRLAVCLISNPMFSAAAVAYSQKELEEFSRSEDPRPRLWYMVEEDKLKEVCGKSFDMYMGKK